MDERKLYILGAILRSYIESAEPIGSRTLQRDFEMKVSPATIRNEMSDLEHLGFLMKAHTSSGRIPSRQAYRWYVDELLSRGVAEQSVPALLDTSLLHHSNELEKVIEGALRMLSDSTSYIAVATIPGRSEDVLRRIELLPLSDHELVIVYVYDTKMVQTDLIHLQEAYSKERVARASEILQTILGNRMLGEVDELLQSGLLSTDSTKGNVFSEIIPAIRQQIESGLETQLQFEGLPKLFCMPEYGGGEEARQMLESLVRGEDFRRLMERPARTMEIFIGDESGVDCLGNSTLICAPYTVRGNLKGKIGILGPTRMEYQKVLADVALMGRYIDSITSRR